jgi:2-polyprenyl-3-methyl-5-hydroxy-6-metoxy-1,4-benzoquinol methylase
MPQPCPLCANQTSTPHLTKYGFHLVLCRACGLIYVSPMPRAEALRAHYDNLKYFSGQPDQGYYDYAAMHRALRPHFMRRLRRLEARLHGPGRLLDVGCADGFFLHLAQARGWKVAGVELSAPMAVRAAQWLGVPVVSHINELSPSAFDAITVWEVIEHLPDPLNALRLWQALLRPGGLLMLSTPNTGHWQAQRAPERWEAFRPPSHLIYFTKETLAAALARTNYRDVQLRHTHPLPPLPRSLERLTRQLELRLATGQARAWPLALLSWRMVRLIGWAGHLLSRPADDVFVTLEAEAVRPLDTP